MNPSDYLHILNPSRKNRSSVRRFFKKNSHLNHVWIDRASHPTHLETVVEWAIKEGIVNIALWGGDGTLSRAVQALQEGKALSKVTLALVATGTGNDFARKLNLHPWKKKFKMIFSETSCCKTFDVGLLSIETGSRIFVNNAGFGRTVEAVREKSSNPIRDISNFRLRRIELEWDTASARNVQTVRAIMGIVFNAPYFNKGMYFDSSMSPEDGLLNAVFIPQQSKLGLVWKFIQSRLGRSLKRKSDFFIEGQTIKMESEEKFFPQVDGEPVGTDGSHTLSFELMKGIMQVLVPGETT